MPPSLGYKPLAHLPHSASCIAEPAPRIDDGAGNLGPAGMTPTLSGTGPCGCELWWCAAPCKSRYGTDAGGPSTKHTCMGIVRLRLIPQSLTRS